MQSTALLGYALVDEASLGFLGLGVQPPDASWGAMINAGRQFIFQAPWLTIIPGLAVIIAVFAINLTGDGLRDVLDPRSSQRVGSAHDLAARSGPDAALATHAPRAPDPRPESPDACSSRPACPPPDRWA